ncbi:unnamed protein product [Commensalibacter communis]|uniref:hypothetical protein n=1 Tax=Commensalibacter communis TaxID=2972786 RepID=UPI0022FF6C49|nr:hypothetical protein [Commensalibacter communis]CAI3929294.1 unnamed protein product [Commensalibacter communis]CAI3929957.1 unnamed protein product [Commensalibacter communis]
MKLLSIFTPYIIGTVIFFPVMSQAQSNSEPQRYSLNMIAYEHKAPNNYATVLYMPYYPAYGLVSMKSSGCNAEIAGYIDPFALKNKKLTITYKRCKISFDINQETQELSQPSETTSCAEYHPKNCSFSQMPTLKLIPLKIKD